MFGRSMGSGPTSYLSSIKNPNALLLMSPYTSIRDAAKALFGWASFLSVIVYEKFRNIDTIKRALEQTPAELSADIVERGIMMTGGGSLLGNLDKVLRRATSLPVSIAEDPLLCVVMGTGKALEEKSKLSDVFASD